MHTHYALEHLLKIGRSTIWTRSRAGSRCSGFSRTTGVPAPNPPIGPERIKGLDLLSSSLRSSASSPWGMHAGYAIYFPELFPTHMRGTGGGFCFNVGLVLADRGR